MKVESREYKLLVNHEPFANPSAAVKAVWDEIEEGAKTLPMVQTKGKLDEKETHSIIFEPNDAERSEKAIVALILWTRGKAGRPAVAELSFRIKDSEEHFSRDLAEAARSVYDLLQRLDCSRPEGMTKTEYIYRDASRD